MNNLEDEVKLKQKNLRDQFETGSTLPYEQRLHNLKQFRKMINECRLEFCDALYSDLHKSSQEGYLTEINLIEHEVDIMINNLRKFMNREKVGNNFLNFPGWSQIQKDPLGVCLIIGAWNQPIQLSLFPCVGALAAGNCVCLKVPSHKQSKSSSSIIGEKVREYFDSKSFCVIEGDRNATTAVLNRRWDLIFFTGGCYVGRMVAESAAKHITPTVLELGGKSPCIIDKSCDITIAAKRFTWGSFMNAGQTCIRPDYLMVHEEIADKFIEAVKICIKNFWGENPQRTEFFGRIINERALDRLEDLINDSSNNIVLGGTVDKNDNQIEPTLVDYGNDFSKFKSSGLMADEIFGPICPMQRYNNIIDVIKYINLGDKPLALQIFATNKQIQRKVLSETSSGGACVNECLLHLSNPLLPFGGVGKSGMGSYHGKRSFDTFSHCKSVLIKTNYLDVFARQPPYDSTKKFILNTLQGVRPQWHSVLLKFLFVLFVSWLFYNDNTKNNGVINTQVLPYVRNFLSRVLNYLNKN